MTFVQGRTRNKTLAFLFLTLFAFIQLSVNAQIKTRLRRPISPEQPMWLVHIDTWNYADPQKIIDLIPEDIRPFVVMNISLSISHDETGRFKVAEYGYEIAKSWLRTCAQNQMWAVVQQSSGGYAQFSDFDLSVYEELYQDFPNLIGFNYAEQFWGYDDPNDPLSPAWTDRIKHFADLLELSNKYGGYLVVSWCGNQWSPGINPIAMLKRIPVFAGATSEYTENFILCEKYTQQSYLSDMESVCLGSYLSGHSGQYGIRYDDTGWTDQNGEHDNFILSTGGAAHLEHIMLTGETVIDAPELIWTQCFRELSPAATTGGYTQRRWDTYPQFDNFSVDLFRKILDGTVRIPSRKEVIDRTKVVVINDQNSGSPDDIYSSPAKLFEGLYRMDGDGNLRNNKTFFKKTGRYPTIPTVFQLDDSLANSFQVKVNHSDYSGRWPAISSKVNELDTIFPAEYTGDLYAGRLDNGWVTYNPYKTGQTATSTIPFKYNTCDSVELTYSQYTSGVMKEYADHLTFYLTNYDEHNSALKTDMIKIYGSSSEPAYSYTDRAWHSSSQETKNWTDGVFSLTVKHNGPVDITVNCSGTATNRLTTYKSATVVTPEKPAFYTGPRQYEAECFDYKNISRNVTSGYSYSIRNYTGQGYMQIGKSSYAGVRDTVYALRKGKYQLITKYSVSGGEVKTLDLYVNGTKIGTPTFTKTATDSDWKYFEQAVDFNTGKNVVEFKANSSGSYSLNIDNIVITQGASSKVYHFENDPASANATDPPAELISIKSGSAGVVAYADANNETTNAFKAYSAGSTNNTGVADLDMFPPSSSDYSITWKEFYSTPGGKKGILFRGTGENGSCSYAEGMKQGYLFIAVNNVDSTITLEPYVANSNGLVNKPTYTSTFKVKPGEPCWFCVIASGSEFTFECSNDSLNWEGSSSTKFTDETYTAGSTEMVWGLNTDNFGWVMDNITYRSGNISISRTELNEMEYMQGAGPSSSYMFDVSGNSLTEPIQINVTKYFEMSLDPDIGYDSTLTLSPTDGTLASTTIYVRLRSGLAVEKYDGSIVLNSQGVGTRTINLAGLVKPQSTIKKYDFSKDVATTNASNPPALDISIGQGNNATAGVVSYTDANNFTSNMFKPYGLGQRNSTGVANLDLFSLQATDYSVTWKQCIGSGSSQYKIGMLLRGDTSKVGDASSGYVQGLMSGYLFIVYNDGTRSEFRIYRSTDTYNSLTMLVNSGVDNLDPEAGQPVWYKASVSGSPNVSLIFEYSTDSINWNKGAVANDISSESFSSGATQIVWGLAVNSLNFYLDNIIFNGTDETTGTLPEHIVVSERSREGFNYMQGFGPSDSQSFKVSADSLTSDIVINAPFGYELSFDSLQNFKSEITLPQVDGVVAETKTYVRLKAGLISNSYNGDVVVSSDGEVSKIVSLSGKVDSGPEIIVSVASINGLNYKEGADFSYAQSFMISAKLLVDDITITAPDNFEISLSLGIGYSSELTVYQNDGKVNYMTAYVRMKLGLNADDYNGDITFSSPGAITQKVPVSGTVEPTTGIGDINKKPVVVVSAKYFTLTGQVVKNIDNLSGIFILKKFMSDGTIVTSKVFKQQGFLPRE